MGSCGFVDPRRCSTGAGESEEKMVEAIMVIVLEDGQVSSTDLEKVEQ